MEEEQQIIATLTPELRSLVAASVYQRSDMEFMVFVCTQWSRYLNLPWRVSIQMCSRSEVLLDEHISKNHKTIMQN